MSDLTNTITADGVVWAGSPPTTNVLTANGAQWAEPAQGEAQTAGLLPLGGSGAGLAIALPQSGAVVGMLPLSGSAQGIAGTIATSGRRLALPLASANGGRLVRPQ